MENKNKRKKSSTKSKKIMSITNNKNFKWLVLGLILLCLTIVTSLAINSFKGKKIVESVNYNAIVDNGEAKVELYEAQDSTLRSVFGARNDFYLANGKQHTRPMYYYFKTDNDIYVYCIELGTMAATGSRTVTNSSTSWSEMNQTQKTGIELATTFGFPNKTRSGYSYELQYLVTQAIIWEFQQGWRTNYNAVPSNDMIYGKIITKDSNVKAVYDSIIKDMKEYSEIPSFAERNVANVVTHTLGYNSSNGKYQATYTDINGVLSGLDVSCNNAICTKNGNELTIQTAVPANVTISFIKTVPKTLAQNNLIIDNGSDQRMLLGRPNINESVSYFKVTTEQLGKIIISKESEDGKKNGFEFRITGPNGYNVTKTTDSNGQIVLNNLKVGNYTITENVDTNKYIAVDAQNVTIDISSLNKTVSFYNILKNNSSVKIAKIDAETKQYLAGAQLEIRKDKTVVDSWKSSTGLHVVSETLDLNTDYQLCETAAPAGYVAGGCQTFKITSKNETKLITMENTPTKIYIKKVDPKNNILVGAHLQVYDSKGTLVDEWDTTTTTHELKRVVIGQKYTIKETKVPDGYVKAADYTFTATNNNTYTMTNVKSKVIIRKTDVTGSKEIAGAHLELLDSNGSKITDWISEEGKQKVIEGLVVGAKYTLKETIAPKGYSVASAVTFTVGATNPTEVVMKNELTKTYFSKVDATNSKEIAGAHLQIIDPSNKNKVVIEWDSEEGKTKLVEGLVEGHTYILRETIAPKGYVLADEIRFVVGDKARITMENKITETTIEKRDAVSKETVEGATLQLIDQNGEIIDEWISSPDPKVIEGLYTGVEYTIKEIKAPDNYLASEPVKFTISASELPKVVIVYDTPIVDVPNTAVNISLQTLIIGFVLLVGGAGTIVWIKKRA